MARATFVRRTDLLIPASWIGLDGWRLRRGAAHLRCLVLNKKADQADNAIDRYCIWWVGHVLAAELNLEDGKRQESLL